MCIRDRRHILNARAQILDAADETPYEMLAQKLAVTEGQMADLRLAGDLTVAAFFSADKPKERETRRRDWAEKFRRADVYKRQHGNSAQPENLILIEELPSGTDFDKAGQQSPAPETDAHRWHASPQSRFERILRETCLLYTSLHQSQHPQLLSLITTFN